MKEDTIDLNFVPRRKLPNENRLINSRAGEVKSIQADCNALHPVAMPCEGSNLIARANLPQLDRLVTGPRKNFVTYGEKVMKIS